MVQIWSNVFGGGRFQETFTALMWKIRPGCKNSNQTTVDSLGVIRAKEEPAAASSTASQSPSHTGSPLARADRQKTRPDPFDSNSGFWALRTAETRDGRKTVWYLQRINSEGTERGSTQRWQRSELVKSQERGCSGACVLPLGMSNGRVPVCP